MTRAVLAAAAALASAAALGTGSARAADECIGLPVCISVPGPWVVVPKEQFRPVSWLLKCPRGIVAGTDARLTRPELDLSFRALLGAPVSPGRTTEDSVLFTGTYTGRPRVATAYRPFIGCVPAQGGSRTPTVYRPGKPTVARVEAVPVVPGRTARLTHGCRPNERLVSWTYAVGIYGEAAPTAAQLGAVRAAAEVREGRILASASRGVVLGSRRTELQVVAVCTRTSRG